MATEHGFLHTPLGWLRVECTDGALVSVDYLEHPPGPQAPSPGSCVDLAMAWLEAYFAGTLLPGHPPLAPQGTPFQQAVWQALAAIPPGQTRTYGELARMLGTAPRAVGGALRSNPTPLFIPCHRIVAAHGLGGYDGGAEAGLRRKRWLLAHESGAARPT
ncbi:MAG TPA: methylated-DNA--[protein]-cysteine S-methyltransferase, partial [Chromatiales bacterium]|nr:methylated-DNA--[protein]-cysteine S-methyltransferase [Chromatiales bacterium]